MKKFSRRTFLRLAGATAMTAALSSACAPKATEEPSQPEQPKKEEPTATTAAAKEPVTLEWWWGWGGTTSTAAMEAIAETFTADNADKNLSVNPLVPEGGMNAKLMPAIAAGTPPDLAVGNISFSEFCARGSFTALDEYFKSSSVVSLRDPDIIASLWEDGSWQGTVYGLAAGEVGPRMGFCYNVDLVEAGGLDPSAPPQTWDEVYDWHVKLTTFDDAKNIDIVGLDPLNSMGGRRPTSDASFFWADSYGFEWWNAENLTFNFNNDKFIATLNMIKKFYDLVGVEQMATYRSSYGTWTGSPTASFPAGKEAMNINGYWTPGTLEHNAPDFTFEYTWPPTSSDRKGIKFQNVGGHPITIPRGAAHPDEAFSFIEYMTTPKAMDIILDNAGFFGARISWLEKIDYDKYPGIEFFLKSSLEADELVPCPLCPISGFVGQQLREGWDAVNYGEKAAEQVAEEIQTACTEEMKKEFPDLVG
jgi:multiple sugar transport system substrate-binding protein